MADNRSGDSNVYLRAAVVTSEHPGKPLEGTVVAMSTSHDLDVDEPYLGEIVKEANERFDIDGYAKGLRIGTVYFDASTRDLVGVSWEESPRSYDHGDFGDVISELPRDMLSGKELL
jgi:hypothetical protein